MRAWEWNVTDSKNLFLTWLFSDIFRYNSPKKCPTILYAVNLWLKPVSATGARLTWWQQLAWDIDFVCLTEQMFRAGYCYLDIYILL